MTSLLLVRPELTRAYRGWGSFLRQTFNTTRRRGPSLAKLSYWDDNLAGYSYWNQAYNLTAQGVPEENFVKLANSYRTQGVPIAAWEVDCNFEYEIWWKGYGGWCWKVTNSPHSTPNPTPNLSPTQPNPAHLYPSLPIPPRPSLPRFTPTHLPLLRSAPPDLTPPQDWLAWNSTAFPSGGHLAQLLANATGVATLPMTYYESPFCADNVQ